MANFRRARMNYQVARQARNGPHWAAHAIPVAREYTPGETVLIRKTGQTAEVEDRTSWGDYRLIGWEGKFFSSDALKPK